MLIHIPCRTRSRLTRAPMWALLITPLTLAAYAQSKPQCQPDPPFYLRGTAYDCAAQAPPPGASDAK
jgi:hypothetical protein